jgi:hypothetical protein
MILQSKQLMMANKNKKPVFQCSSHGTGFYLNTLNLELP